ncbi:hypothetical protein KKF38_00900 [Patescibacteria group bacterium]|nr:hypothetical protein [Patescibacteria group bacterium]
MVEKSQTTSDGKNYTPAQIEAAKNVSSYFKCADDSQDPLKRKYSTIACVELGKGVRLGKTEEEIRKNVAAILGEEYIAAQTKSAESGAGGGEISEKLVPEVLVEKETPFLWSDKQIVEAGAMELHEYFKYVACDKGSNALGIELGKKLGLGRTEEEVLKNVAAIIKKQMDWMKIGIVKGIKAILDNSGNEPDKLGTELIKASATLAGLEIEITGNEEVDRENIQKLVAEILEE